MSASLFGRRLRLERTNNLSTNGAMRGLSFSKEVQITSAQLLALNATPQTLVAAPGTGRMLIFQQAFFYLPYNSAAYGGIAAGEDLAIRYTGSSGQIVGTQETTGFLDQTSSQRRLLYAGASPVATATDVVPVSNAALVLHLLTGEITTGNSPLNVRVFWFEVPDTVTP